MGEQKWYFTLPELVTELPHVTIGQACQQCCSDANLL